MGKIVVEAEVSLDGVTGGANVEFWGQVFRLHGEDVTGYLNELLFAPDALLMGRKTYEGFAQVWPTREGEDADRINRMPKYVASRTLKRPLGWNATLIEGDVAQEIAKLKKQSSRGLVQYGVGELTQTMLRHGLVDELRVLVYPFVFGRGERLINDFDNTELKLLETRTFSTGVVALHYQPQQK
jgi:dihydrofolate reductase